MPIIYKRESARIDLVERFVYLAENASIDVAERFLVNAESSFNDLLAQPLIEAPILFQNPALSGLRKWSIKEFKETLIFYIPRKPDITIIRVLSAAQDWWNLIGIKN